MGICATCSRDLSRKCSELEGKAAALEAELTKIVAELKGKDEELTARLRSVADIQTRCQRMEDELKDEGTKRQAAEDALARSLERSGDLPDVMEGLLTSSVPVKDENGHAGRMTKSLVDLQDEDVTEDKKVRRKSIGLGIEA